MKILNIGLFIIATILIAYNLTLVDYKNPINEDSTIALIGVVAGLCVILLLIILNISKKIQRTLK